MCIYINSWKCKYVEGKCFELISSRWHILKHINYFQIFNKKDLLFFQNSIFIYVCTSGEWGSLAALTDINYHISQRKIKNWKRKQFCEGK
jgi:hypothetical protein